jgi:A/G-specific adenine glycosylase
VHLCQWLAGVPQPLASQQVRWVEPNALREHPFPAANTRIIAALHAWLGGLENPGHGGRELPWA